MAMAAVCVLVSVNVTGTLLFTQQSQEEPVHIMGQLTGLSPGLHGFHIHQYGDLTGADCLAAGGHFNPDGEDHGAPNASIRHVGDLGNICANQNGEAHVNITDYVISLWDRNSIIGRSVVVHKNEDDLGLGGDAESLKTGNAGPRLACGVIGIRAPSTE